MRRRTICFILAAALLLIAIAVPLVPNAIVVETTKRDIRAVTAEDGYNCALVLGAKVHEGGRLSDMLRDRMDAAIALYHAGAVQTLLLSGDGSGPWSEVVAMRDYAVENGVPDEAILLDGEGYSTYESVSRAKKIYGIEKLVLVTQKYHLHRALYIAEDFGLDAVGADAALHHYAGQAYREVREILARDTDFTLCLFN